MSGEDDLADALVAAQARMDSAAARPKVPKSEDEELAALRSLARIFGHEPDEVIASFLQGGPLADLVRTIMGATRPHQRGPGAPQRADTLQTYLRVLEIMNDAGVSRYAAINACAAEIGVSPETVKRRVNLWRKRKRTLAAIYRLRIA